MPEPIQIRPMRDGDVAAVHETGQAAFEDLERRTGEDPSPPPVAEEAHARLRRVLATDPEGSWVAVRDGEVVGCSIAILREGVWGLSFLVVHPGAQSSGTGRGLLARAWEYGREARGWIILSSKDPRALRAYARLGLTLHPCVMAAGSPRDATVPPAVRPGSLADLPLTETVDRAVRGAARGGDIRVQLETGATMVVIPGRGYATVLRGQLLLLAARAEDAASDLLRAVIAGENGDTAVIDWITAAQAWAVGPCLDAGLELRPSGAVFVAGDVGPFTPYLPSGPYL